MHHSIRTFALAATLAALGGTAFAQPVPAVERDVLRDVMKTLASDEFEGRGPATPAERKTTDFIVAQFQAAGLKPGNHGQWLQDVPTVHIAPVHVSALQIGTLPPFVSGRDFVINSYREVPHVAIAQSDLVFVGFGINAPELGWNDYAGIDVKGKVVVILVNDPDYAQNDERGLFKGRRMTWYGRWPYKFEEAARQGARAALIVHDTFPAAYGWNVVQSSWGQGANFIASPGKGMDQTQANGWIQKPVAEAVFKAAGQDFAALSEAARHKGFHAVPLGLTASLSFDSEITHAMSHNVIGIQPGRARPDETVLYTAHWDHLGHCPADARGDGICNGAVDNASGVATLVELARMNHRAGPAQRSQVFIALTLEESGLLGSAYYAQHPVYPLALTAGGINMDGNSPVGPARDVVAIGGDKSELTAILDRVDQDMGLTQSPEAHPERGSYYRSDHFSFARVGVPMFSVGRGRNLVDGGQAAGDAAAEDYVAHRYHQPGDEFSPDWTYAGMAQQTELFYRLGRALSDSGVWPNWHAGDEFRAIRDASAAARH
jgi:Zn-dependent M28 family amino/carboxypeptidase